MFYRFEILREQKDKCGEPKLVQILLLIAAEIILPLNPFFSFRSVMMLTHAVNCRVNEPIFPRVFSSQEESFLGGGLNQVACRWQRQRAGSLRINDRGRKSWGTLGIRCKAPSVGQHEFEEVVLKSEVPVLVDFWAGWCGPCKLVSSSVDAIEKKYIGKLKVVKVETDPNPQLVEKYKVYGLPTLILFEGGQEVPGSRREGAVSMPKLESMLKQKVPSLTTN